MKIFKQPFGFTLLEYIIYIGIAAVVLLSAVLFSRTIIQDQIKQERRAEVNYNGGFVLNKIIYFGERAGAFGPQTVYGTNPGILAFTTSTETVVIDTYQKNITVGSTPIVITKLRARHGTNTAYDLTTDAVGVAYFSLVNLSGGSVSSVKLYLQLEAVNPGGSKTYEAKQSFSTTITLHQ